MLGDRLYPRWVVGDRLWVKETYDNNWYHHYDYAAESGDDWRKYGPWKSPRFMPKDAARIWLEIKRIRCERLQEITDIDGEAEGFKRLGDFIEFWDSMHEKKGRGRRSNPWVWVIEFKRIREIRNFNRR